jgi:[CysO sulfur-carrier protein]-S-L-cysteine hydrolase
MPEQPLPIRLPRRLHKALFEYACGSPAVEICGLLGGEANRLTSFYPVRNIAGQPERSFLLEAEGQIEAMRRMRDSGESLRGIFHSHPDSPAAPSATDLDLAAYPDTYYLILSLAGPELELGTYHYDGQAFRAVSIEIT